MAEYDFASLYGQADNSSLLYDETWHPSVIESAEFGRTRDGTKGQWVVRHRISAGRDAGKMPLSGYITVSPPIDPSASEDDQRKQARAIGMMFRRLASLGIPVPDPKNPAVCVNGQAPFWMMGWSEEQVAAAMNGKSVRIKIKHDDYDGVTRNKIADWAPAQPGDPADWPRDGGPAPVQQGFAQPPAGYGQPQQQAPAQQGWQMAPPNPAFAPPQQVQPPAPYQPQQQPPWGQPQPQQAAPQQQYASPAQNGQGQAQPAWGQPQQAPPPVQVQQPGAVPQPPWGQQAAQQPQQAPQQPAGPEAPPPPPWAQ